LQGLLSAGNPGHLDLSLAKSPDQHFQIVLLVIHQKNPALFH
jgi:hypothetical protein